MIIKKGTKYYLVEKEMSKAEFDEYKNNIQKHYNTLEERIKVWSKAEKDKIVFEKANAKKQLDELNAL